MTADLYAEEAPDSEDFVVCWLQPLLRSATERDSDDALPFAVVTRIVGTDDPDSGSCIDVVQVDIFDRGAAAGSRTQRDVHRRMNLLAREQQNVTLSDGSLVAPDSMKTLRRPSREPYKDENIVLYVARYQLGLSFIAA